MWARLSPPSPTTIALTLLLPFALVGCASFDAQVGHDVDLGSYEEYFVQRNHNDDHGIGSMISEALRRRGFASEVGYLTALPDSAQAIVVYEDRWTWDAKNHMTALSLSLRDARSGRILGRATYSGPIAMNADPIQVVDELVAKLFAGVHPARPAEKA